MNTQTAQLEAAIDWLCESVDQSTKFGSKPDRLTEAEKIDAVKLVEKIHEAIYPRRLPPEIIWFWTTWSTYSFSQLLPFPSLTDPGFALDSWLANPEWPRSLFWVAYDSHCFLAVELDYPGSVTSQIFSDCYASGDGLRLIAPNLAVFIGITAAGIAENPELAFDTGLTQEVERRCDEALAVNGIGTEQRGPYNWYDLLQCPKRWRLEQGIDDASLALRGATCTIDELHSARENSPIEATIVGRTRTAAGTGAGRVIVVDDDTGRAEVWVPVEVPSVGDPTFQNYEIDVLAMPSGRAAKIEDLDEDHREIVRRALSGDTAGAPDAIRRIGEYLAQSHPIVALALRPIK